MTLIDETPLDVRRRRRPRRRTVLAAGVLIVVGGLSVLWWQVTRPPSPVSVNDAVNRFRTAQPTAPATAPISGGPAVGVYVYATDGSERISSANITHHYPSQTTLTVTSDPCGLQIRWDALSGRWWKAQVCAAVGGWRLVHYTDAHKFLYMQDIHDYTCEPPAVTADGWSVVCRTSGGVLTSTLHRLGTAKRSVSGRAVTTQHVRIDQRATGKSLSEGTIDAWVLASGLPVHLQIDDHGSQTVLGSRITYQERASFDLTSLSPRR